MKFNTNPWTQEEDNNLHKIVEEVGRTKWSLVSKTFNQQSSTCSRSAKQCRERWINYANPDINKSSWSLEEKKKINELHKMFGSKWALIASHLDGRTENSVKNFFYSDQRKTLRRDKKKIRKELERLNVFEPNHSLKSKRELNIPTFLMENSNFNNQVIESLESSFDAPSISFSFNFNPYLYDQNCFLIDFKNNENLDFQVYAFSEV